MQLSKPKVLLEWNAGMCIAPVSIIQIPIQFSSNEKLHFTRGCCLLKDFELKYSLSQIRIVTTIHSNLKRPRTSVEVPSKWLKFQDWTKTKNKKVTLKMERIFSVLEQIWVGRCQWLEDYWRVTFKDFNVCNNIAWIWCIATKLLNY